MDGRRVKAGGGARNSGLRSRLTVNGEVISTCQAALTLRAPIRNYSEATNSFAGEEYHFATHEANHE